MTSDVKQKAESAEGLDDLKDRTDFNGWALGDETPSAERQRELLLWAEHRLNVDVHEWAEENAALRRAYLASQPEQPALAEPLIDEAAYLEHLRQMRDEVGPEIERDLREQSRAAFRLRLGQPEPPALAAVGEEPIGTATKHGLALLYDGKIHDILMGPKGTFRPENEVALYTTPLPSPDVAALQTQAAKDVLAERQRQVTAEGWTPEHDDEHDNGELAKAAACYAIGRPEIRRLVDVGTPDVVSFVMQIWPWSTAWWKPTNPRRNLVKAAALILAEIERLDRADASK